MGEGAGSEDWFIKEGYDAQGKDAQRRDDGECVACSGCCCEGIGKEPKAASQVVCSPSSRHLNVWHGRFYCLLVCKGVPFSTQLKDSLAERNTFGMTKRDVSHSSVWNVIKTEMHEIVSRCKGGKNEAPCIYESVGIVM